MKAYAKRSNTYARRNNFFGRNMKNRLSHRDYQDMVIENHYPNDFGGLEEVNERLQCGKFFFGQGEYKEFFFKGFHIGYGNLSLEKPIKIDIECDYQTIQMSFTFSGKKSTTEIHSNLQTESLPNQHNICYINCFQGQTFWDTTQDMQLFDISMVPELFLKYLPTTNENFRVFRENIEQGRTCALSPHNHWITPAMQWIIRDIISCQRKGFFKRVYLENKVIELLILQLEQMGELTEPTCVSLNKGVVEKMMVVKEFIETHEIGSCSLSELAKAAGTNEYTLKKAFKRVFGTTVFGYWNQLKMAEAKALLMDGAVSVTEVAKRMGYKNPQHFTTAFKRTFGRVPSKWIYKNEG